MKLIKKLIFSTGLIGIIGGTTVVATSCSNDSQNSNYVTITMGGTNLRSVNDLFTFTTKKEEGDTIITSGIQYEISGEGKDLVTLDPAAHTVKLQTVSLVKKELKLITKKDGKVVWENNFTVSDPIVGGSFQILSGNTGFAPIHAYILFSTFANDSTTYGYDGVVYNKSDILTVSLSNDQTTLPSMAFANCTGLTTFDFTNIKTIGSNAFNGCKNLNTINLSLVNSIGDHAFDECPLTSLSIDSNNQSYELLSGAAAGTNERVTSTTGGFLHRIRTSDVGIISPTVGTTGGLACGDITFHEGITKVEANSFANSALQQVDFACNVTEIGEKSFYESAITKIKFESGCAPKVGTSAFESCIHLGTAIFTNDFAISDRMFYKCTSLNDLETNVTTVFGTSSFQYCADLTAIVLSSATAIGDNAFANSGCLSIALGTRNEAPSWQGKTIFSNVAVSGNITVFGIWTTKATVLAYFVSLGVPDTPWTVNNA